MPLDLGNIGQVLKNAREEKGLTIEQVAARLFISKGKLDAIENGDWRRLPHQVYIRGYIIQYATFLNVLDLVRAELAAPEAEADQARQKDAPKGRVAIPMSQGLRKRVVSIGITGAVLLGFLIFMNVRTPHHVVQQPQQQALKGAPQAAAEQAAAAANQQDGAAAGAQTVAGQPQDQKAAAQAGEEGYQTVAGQDRSEAVYDKRQDKLVLAPKKLMIACQERTWLAIVIDGTERKEFTLNPEEVVVLNANEKFDVLIGNVGGVKLFYNGKEVSLPGESGEVKRVTLS